MANVHMIGSRLALELMLTGSTISAQRAYEIGFVNRLVPKDELLPAALTLADEVIECAPLSVAAVRPASRGHGCAMAPRATRSRSLSS